MAQNGYEYRAVFSNLAGTATTSAATIVVASESGNWSGYFALGQAFSAVTGSLQSVPAVTCPDERYQLFVAVDRDRRRPEPDRRAGRHRVRLLRRHAELRRLVRDVRGQQRQLRL